VVGGNTRYVDSDGGFDDDKDMGRAEEVNFWLKREQGFCYSARGLDGPLVLTKPLRNDSGFLLSDNANYLSAKTLKVFACSSFLIGSEKTTSILLELATRRQDAGSRSSAGGGANQRSDLKEEGAGEMRSIVCYNSHGIRLEQIPCFF